MAPVASAIRRRTRIWALAFRHQRQVFGAQTDGDLLSGIQAARIGNCLFTGEVEFQALSVGADCGEHEVHRRRAHEAGNKLVDRLVVKFQRCAFLLDFAGPHQHHPVGHGHGFDLVMRDVNGGCLQPVMKCADFLAHVHAKGGVEVGQRFIEEECFRVADDGTAHRNALTLATRKLTRGSVSEAAKVLWFQPLRGPLPGHPSSLRHGCECE